MQFARLFPASEHKWDRQKLTYRFKRWRSTRSNIQIRVVDLLSSEERMTERCAIAYAIISASGIKAQNISRHRSIIQVVWCEKCQRNE